MKSFDKYYEKTIYKKSVELFIKNIKNIFDGLPKNARIIKSKLNNPNSTETYDFFGYLTFFKEIKDIFKLINKS